MKVKKIFNIKNANRFIKVAISGMLMFSMMIPSAVSYQQAISTVGENAYTIGEGIDVSIETKLNASEALYPSDAVGFSSTISNNGDRPVWAILAIKIPSMKQPFTTFFTKNHIYSDFHAFITTNADTNSEFGSLYYPAFYIVDGETDINSMTNRRNFIYTGVEQRNDYGIGDCYEIYADDIKWMFDKVSESANQVTFNQLQANLSCQYGLEACDWTFLGTDTTYAYKDNGFYVYYIGTKLNAHSTACPFTSMVSANFQDKIIGEDGSVTDIAEDSLSTYIGVSAKAYAIQASSEYGGNASSTITDIWNTYKDKLPIFGTDSVVNVVTQTSYTKGSHEVTFTATEGVNKLKIVNEDTKDVQIITVSENGTVTTTKTGDNRNKLSDDDSDELSNNNSNKLSDAKALNDIAANVNFTESGQYTVQVYSETAEDYVNKVDMGYITVT